MVVKEAYEGESSYRCETCGFHYLNKDVAKECEEFCRKNNSCSQELTSKALERQ